MIIYLPYIHAISILCKKNSSFKQSVSLLVKKKSRASELLAEDSHVKEIITLEKDMDGFNGMFKFCRKMISSGVEKKDFSKVFIFNSSLRYNVISRLAGIKSIYQYPF